MNRPRVLLVSPSRYSLYTLCVAERLRNENVEVAGIVVRKLVNLRRFRAEWRRDGKILLAKIWRKLVLRERAPKRAVGAWTLADEKSKLGIASKSIDAYAKARGIPVCFCEDLNDTRAIEFARSCRVRLAFFTGGGLVRAPFLEACGEGVLNAHLGVLPMYRGMDVVEWPLLERRRENLGITVHFMDSGLDTGDILRVHPCPAPARDIAGLREHLEGALCEAIVTTGLDYLRGALPRRPQNITDGRQYFRMHPLLKEIAQGRLG